MARLNNCPICGGSDSPHPSLTCPAFCPGYEKFADDEEFRTNASRFLADFEKLLQQADEADSDDILSASLLTADVGKTYLLMSRARERLK